MRQPTHDSMMTITQFWEHVERHMQRLQEMRVQGYILLQHTQEHLTTTRHKIALSKTLLQQTSKEIAHLHGHGQPRND